MDPGELTDSTGLLLRRLRLEEYIQNVWSHMIGTMAGQAVVMLPTVTSLVLTVKETLQAHGQDNNSIRETQRWQGIHLAQRLTISSKE